MKETRKLFKKGDYNNYYISNTGLLKKGNKATNKEFIIKGSLTPKKYRQYAILGKKYLAHRLVGSCFLGLDIEDTKTLVCHKDDNPQNNKVSNLFLGTAKDNLVDASKKNRMKTKLSTKDIKEIRDLFVEGKSNRYIGKVYGVSNVSIFKLRHNTLRNTASYQ